MGGIASLRELSATERLGSKSRLTVHETASPCVCHPDDGAGDDAREVRALSDTIRVVRLIKQNSCYNLLCVSQG